MIKAFVFDIGNVVWEFKPLCNQLFRSWAQLVNLSYEDFFEEFKKVYVGFETDQSNVVDWLKTFKPSITKELVDSKLEDAFGNYKKFSSYFNNEVINLIKSLKTDGFPVICLSNTENYFYPYIKKYITPFFDQAILSWQVKDRKPNFSIYQNIFKYGNWKPEEVVFIDDKLENVEAAKFCGLEAIQFIDYPQLISELPTVDKHLLVR